MERALSSLAILKVEWDRGRDYIDCFVPFVAEALRTSPQPQVSIPQLQTVVRDRFQISIPQGALATILSRLVRRGFVARHQGIYVASDMKLAQVTLASDSADALREVGLLVGKLVEYSSSQFSVKWSEQEAEAALISSMRSRSIPILSAAVEGTPIPQPTTQVAHADFIVSLFIASMHSGDPQAFSALSVLVKGMMLANVLYFPELGQVQRRFRNVEFYLDTSVLLRAMGLATSGEQLGRREMMDLLYGLNASIRRFQHTVRELQGVLGAAAVALRSPRSLRHSHGEAIEYFVAAKCSPSDVELLIARLQDFLEGIHVSVRPTPPHEVALGLDELRFEKVLQEGVGYAREETLRHDLDAISAIHRLRRGSFPQEFEDSIAVFVTDNYSLVGASAEFFRLDYGEQASAVPHCLPYHLIATLAWLKNPRFSPDLPERLVIADCYAALNPPTRSGECTSKRLTASKAGGNNGRGLSSSPLLVRGSFPPDEQDIGGAKSLRRGNGTGGPRSHQRAHQAGV